MNPRQIRQKEDSSLAVTQRRHSLARMTLLEKRLFFVSLCVISVRLYTRHPANEGPYLHEKKLNHDAPVTRCMQLDIKSKSHLCIFP